MDRLRWLSAAGDLESSLSIFDQMRRLRRPCSEFYNLIMSLYVSNRMDSDAVSTFNQMVRDGAIPNSRTFTVLIDHLVAAGETVRAWEVFARLPSMRVRRTSRQYSSLASGFDSIGRFDLLRSLIAEMRHVDGLLPNRAMRDALKKMREAGFVEETEAFVGEFSPDDRIGCVDDGSSDGDDEEGVVELKRWIDPNALARALEGWEPSEISELEGARIVWTTRLVCKMLRAFKNPETAWEFFNWVAYQPGRFAHDAHTVSRMIVALARHGLAEPAAALLLKIEREEIKLPFSNVRAVEAGG
ncbi:Pentatricopeptide repeat-containing protein [Acorus calamus]|uniref:Pentatricopeptide repeat-containing protein n=1 Tax=Acorus calamus TaxID=4465 RepID=A0AAV9ENU2_ACOCL|nr:Pentatricopeptide repeat-containing protein [Acorus calamus]